MMVENSNIRATVVSATEYPDIVRQYGITGVPKTVVNDSVEIFGAQTEEVFIKQALEAFGSDNGKPKAFS
jgi:predicted DsbA family dithiol-disulfide isomerase